MFLYSQTLAKSYQKSNAYWLLYGSWIVFRAIWYLINELYLGWRQSLALLFSSVLLRTKKKWNLYPQRQISTPRSSGLPCMSHLTSIITVHWTVPDTFLQWSHQPCLSGGSFPVWCDPGDALLTSEHRMLAGKTPSGARCFANLLRSFMVFWSSQRLNSFIAILAII